LLEKTLADSSVSEVTDLVSGGRLELEMGAGWYEEEYEAAGIPFEPPGVRIARLTEALQIVTSLLSRPELSFSGT
jgi:alkanesulfonate monooxygenase SsuD/methylene tetrahydromethanopterin reductase-like flavin-dependent oxidoreductase (luciferase family)